MRFLLLLSLLLLFLAEHCHGQRTLVSLRNKLKTLDSRKRKSDSTQSTGKEPEQDRLPQRWIFTGLAIVVVLVTQQLLRRGEY